MSSEKKLAYQRIYYQENKEALKTYQKLYWQKYKTEMDEIKKTLKEQNNERK